MRVLALLIAAFLMTGAAEAKSSLVGSVRTGGSAAVVPAPRLVEPRGEEVDLKGRRTLEFRWTGQGDRTRFRYYDFRIYSGFPLVEANLIHQERLEDGSNRTEVSAELFTEGETYVWGVRRVQYGGMKSRRNTASFKVTAK